MGNFDRHRDRVGVGTAQLTSVSCGETLGHAGVVIVAVAIALFASPP